MTGAAFYAALAAASHCAAGCSQKEAAWQSDQLTLYRYRPIARPAAGGVPLLIMVPPVDFHSPADLLLSKWASKIDVAAWVGNGSVSGDALNQLFLSLMPPFRLMHQKYVDLVAGSPDRDRIENFMRFEQWIFDSPDQPGAAFREF